MERQSPVDPRTQWLLKDDGKVLIGRNGRLFLDTDRNNVLKQHTGELRFSNSDLRAWQCVLENRIAWLQRLDIPYFFLVPPNAHSVYPEDLPQNVESARVRPIHQLIDHLQEAGSPARLIYPLEALVAAKPDPLLYSRTDSHWSDRGAFIAYTCIAREIAGEIPINQVQEGAVSFRREVLVGELGYKVQPPQQSEHILANVLRPRAFLVHDNRVFNRGMKVITACPAAPAKTCLMLGDSFSGQLLGFFAASFRRFVFAHISTLDYDLVVEEQPDVVVSVMNERFLITIPEDSTGASAKELEAHKIAGQQFRPELRFWPRAQHAELPQTQG